MRCNRRPRTESNSAAKRKEDLEAEECDDRSGHQASLTPALRDPQPPACPDRHPRGVQTEIRVQQPVPQRQENSHNNKNLGRNGRAAMQTAGRPSHAPSSASPTILRIIQVQASQMRPGELTAVFSADEISANAEAEVLKTLLESAGIASFVRQIPATFQRPGGIRLMVLAEDFDDADALIREAMESAP